MMNVYSLYDTVALTYSTLLFCSQNDESAKRHFRYICQNQIVDGCEDMVLYRIAKFNLDNGNVVPDHVAVISGKEYLNVQNKAPET